MRPTILNLMGVESDTDMQFGSDLFSEERDEFAIFRDGRFVTDDYVYAGSTCYENRSGQLVDQELCAPFADQALTELNYSERVINGDLLRFYDEETGQLLDADQ